MRRFRQTDQIPDHRRQNEQVDSAAGHQKEQLVFKVLVQFPAGMVRHIHRGLYKIEGCQRRHHGVSGARHVWLEQDRGVHRAL